LANNQRFGQLGGGVCRSQFMLDDIMTTILERLIEPLAEFMTVESAAKIAALRADEDSQQLLDRLPEKANLGVITLDERAEYNRLLAWFMS
jgi:hypothetical protein